MFCRWTRRGTLRLADPRPQIAVDRDELHLLPGHPDGSGQCRPQCAEPATQHYRRCRDSQGRRRRSAALGRRCPGRLFLLRAGRQAPLRLQLRRAANFYHVESNVAVPEGRHKLRFEFEVTGKPDIKSGQGRAGPRPALHRRQAGRTGRHSSHDATHHWACRRHRLRRRHAARRCGTSTNRRSSSPARSTARPWT